jgi:hypothetical protein
MLAAVLAALVLASPAGGVYGVVRKGPTKPVCEVGMPCTAPALGVRLLFVRDGVVAGRVTTSAGGRYRVALRAGTYLVRTAVKPGIGRGLEPSRVVVPRSRYARVDFMLDTGIR